ncbi:MAG: AraC family transcriptional regulator [Phycicoccus sp.]|nr:AraC family transcriptional regulator [Phycicoccus sp.]
MTQLPDDTRGIIAPGAMMRHVDFQRYAVPAPLEGLLDWFWSVRWTLPLGFTHRQELLQQPGVNISVGTPPPPGPSPPPGPYPLRMVVNGVATSRTTRALSGHGWNVAAKTTTGGFGAWVDDVAALNDLALPAAPVLGLDADALAADCAQEPFDAIVARLGTALVELLDRRDLARVALARDVARTAFIAETDREVRRVTQLATAAGVTPRTLQRVFASCAGVSPTWVIRRYRLLDAAERVREGQVVDWAGVAGDLGYADQAHLVRDFTSALGRSPAAYAKDCRA